MKINHDIQLSDGKLKHLLNINKLPKSIIEDIINRAEEFHDNSEIIKYTGKVVASLFFEPSTRTKTTFELATKKISSDFINIDIASSSTSKGESIIDMIKTIEAMKCNMFVVRHSVPGTAHFIAESVSSDIAVINAGDGRREHPTQALLDALTIINRKRNIEGLKIAICGDILHSRVARSNIYLMNMLGAEVNVIAPKTLMPKGIDNLGVKSFTDMKKGLDGCDIVMMLRLQNERMQGSFLPSKREYYEFFGLTPEKLKFAKKDALLMHPGPMNRGVEIDTKLADDINVSLVKEQVELGVAVRMACLKLYCK